MPRIVVGKEDSSNAAYVAMLPFATNAGELGKQGELGEVGEVGEQDDFCSKVEPVKVCYFQVLLHSDHVHLPISLDGACEFR